VDSNYLIEGNVIVNVPESGGLTIQSAHGITIRNNVIYNNAGGAIQFSGDSSYSNRDVELYNNTLYNNGGVIGIDHVDGIIIKNNLVFGNSSRGNYRSSSNITSDYNLWAPINASWSEGTHSIIQTSASGIVVDPAGGDFRLTAGSPAIAKGVALNATGFATILTGTPGLRAQRGPSALTNSRFQCCLLSLPSQPTLTLLARGLHGRRMSRPIHSQSMVRHPATDKIRRWI